MGADAGNATKNEADRLCREIRDFEAACSKSIRAIRARNRVKELNGLAYGLYWAWTSRWAIPTAKSVPWLRKLLGELRKAEGDNA